MAGTANFTLTAGDTFKKRMTFFNDDNTPCDITGWSFAMDWKLAPLTFDKLPALSFSSATNDGITLDDVPDKNQITIRKKASVRGGTYLYDLEITKPDDTVFTYIKGSIIVPQDVTNSTTEQ